MIVLLIITILCSCSQKHSLTERTYTAYANDDIAFTTEAGEMIFIPFNGLLNEEGIYHGRVNIHLASYRNLLDTLGRYVDRESWLHLLQLSSPVIDCTDEAGHSLKINIQSGYEMLVLMPLLPDTAHRYADSLIWHPDDLFIRKNTFDSFGINADLRYIPPFTDQAELFAISKTLPATGAKDFREDAELVYNKWKSIHAFQYFLKENRSNAIGQFIRSLPPQFRIRTEQADHADNLPFIAFSILELYNRTGPRNLMRLFRRYNRNWQNSLLIADWTGSMLSHRTELIDVVKDLQMQGIIRHLALYNDNPDPGKPDLNETEGFFYLDSVRSFQQIEKLMDEAEADYGGGTLEEDDFAALLRATSMKDPAWRSDYGQIIMLVDNNAPPRNLSLFSRLDLRKKIYVIAYDADDVCEVYKPYHDLVKKFGGLLIAEGNGSAHNCQEKNIDSCITDHYRMVSR